MRTKKVKVSVGFTYFVEGIVDADDNWEKIYEEQKPLVEDEIKNELASILGVDGEMTDFFVSVYEQKMKGTDDGEEKFEEPNYYDPALWE
jgi:hypothetical protein